MKLPPYVVRRRKRFAGWVSTAEGKVYGPSRETPQAAYQDALEMRDEKALGLVSVTFGDAKAAVIAETKANRTAETARWYREHFGILSKQWPDATWLHSIRAEAIEQWARDRLRSVSPATVNADLRAMHRLFAWAIRTGKGSKNPVRQVVRPRQDRPARDWFREDDLSELLSQVTGPARPLFLLIAYSGMRREEVLRLRADMLNLRTMQVVVAGKNGTRVLPLSEDIRDELGALAFPITPKFFDECFAEWRGKLKEPRWRSRALRHSFATMLVRQGTPLHVVMHLLGHRSIKTTMIYAHEHGEDGIAAVRRIRLVRGAEKLAQDQQAGQ